MAIENMIRHYNNNKLTEFRKESFGRVFLTRQNRLLAKLVASRASHGQLHAQLIERSYTNGSLILRKTISLKSMKYRR
jgi:hypothetical protein